MSVTTVDAGFSAFKVKTDHNEFSFPTLVVIPYHQNVAEDGAKVYGFEGINYVIGDKTVKGQVLHERNFEYLLKFMPVFLARAIEESDIHPGSLTEVRIGIPYDDYRSRRGEMEERLKDFSVSGVRYHSTTGEIENDFAAPKTGYRFKLACLPQGIGAFLEYDAMVEPEKVEDGYLIDVGFNTCILQRFLDGKAQKSGSKQIDRYGLSVAMESIQKSIEAVFGKSPSIIKVCEAFRAGTYSFMGKKMDNFDEICKTAVRLHLADMLHELFDVRSKEFEQIQQLVIAGGGSYYVTKDLIPVDYRDMTVIVDPNTQPEFANVRGLHRL